MKKTTRKLFRIICLGLCFVLLFGVIGCNNQNTNPPEEGLEESLSYNYSTGIDYEQSPLKVVENSVAKYSILVSSDASSTLLGVVAELNSYFQKVSGAVLPIISSISGSTSVISIGETDLSETSGIDVSSVKYDGYAIKSVGENIFLMANNDRGLQNAIYTFIERFLGVRWLSIKETYIPSNVNIDVYPCEIVEEPNFKHRVWLNAGAWSYPEYVAHMKFYTGEDTWCRDVDTSHNTSDGQGTPGIGYVNKVDIDPTDAQGRTLGEAHPEYFTDYTNKTTFYDLCFTNGINEDGTAKDGQSVLSLMVDKMISFLQADAQKQEIEYFMVGHSDDRAAVCKCETCLTRREKYLDAGIWVMYMNCLEQEVNTWLQANQNRTVQFIMFAYQYTFDAPVKEVDGGYQALSPLCIPNDNIHIRIAPIDADYTYSMLDEKQKPDQAKAIAGWGTIARNMMIWDYQSNYVEYYWYYPTTHYLKDNLKYYKSINTTYVSNQSSYTQEDVPFDLIRSYVSSRLYWNFDWDVNALIKEYVTLYYGPAAECMMQVINMFENFYNEARKDVDFVVSILSETDAFFAGETYPIEFLNAIIRKIENTQAEINNNTELSVAEKIDYYGKLELVKLTPMLMILRNYTTYYSEDTKVNYAIKVFAICDNYGVKNLGEGASIRSVAARKAQYGL